MVRKKNTSYCTFYDCCVKCHDSNERRRDWTDYNRFGFAYRPAVPIKNCCFSCTLGIKPKVYSA